MDKKVYKRIDWSKRKPKEECNSSGDKNINIFSATLNSDGEWATDKQSKNQIEE